MAIATITYPEGQGQMVITMTDGDISTFNLVSLEWGANESGILLYGQGRQLQLTPQMIEEYGTTISALSTSIETEKQSSGAAQNVRSVGETDGGQTVYQAYTPEGHAEVAIHSPKLPFGSVHTESLRPIFQSDAVYGLNDGMQKWGSSLSGTATADDSKFVVSTGTTSLAQAYIQSRKRLRYRAGQGVVGRFTGLFSAPASYAYQIAGFGHSEDGVYFGYREIAGATPKFGILYVNRGRREVRTLTVATGSSTAENITVQLNGVSFLVAVTNSGSTLRTAYEISRGTFTGWQAYPVGSTVVFVNDSAGAKSGAYSITATTATGLFAATRAGAAATETFIPQDEWNGDTLDGNGPSGYNANWQRGQVFQIGIQYLGFGAITFEVEVVDTGRNNATFVTVHTLKLPNTLTTTSFRNPSFPFSAAVYSTGSTTDVSVSIGSYAGFIEGAKVLHGIRSSYYNATTGVTASDYKALFTVRNNLVFGGIPSQVVVNLISTTGAVKHTQPVTAYLVKNGVLAGTPNFTNYATNSATSWDTAATTVTWSTNDQVIWTGHCGETGDWDHHFGNGEYNAQEVTLQPGEYLTLAARSVQNNVAWCTGSINTREDQ